MLFWYTVGKEIDTELSFLVHPAERLFDTKYKKQSEAGRKKFDSIGETVPS